jgi:regulator of RNase E activity RraA
VARDARLAQISPATSRQSRDGLVIVQGDKVEEIRGEAEEKVAAENEIRESVRRGKRPLEAYERYGTF